jgi:hypothetical protein
MTRKNLIAAAVAAFLSLGAPVAAQASARCADVSYRYGSGTVHYTMVATSITARGVACGTARHLASAAVRAHVYAYRFRSCTRVLRRTWVNCEVPKHLDGFTLSYQHILSDLGRVVATRGGTTVRFAIYRT